MKVLGLIAAVFGAANYAPLLKTYPEQDACAFGPVSNEQYRSYLSEVKVSQRTTWPAFTASARAQFTNRHFGDLVREHDGSIRLEMKPGTSNIFSSFAPNSISVESCQESVLNLASTDRLECRSFEAYPISLREQGLPESALKLRIEVFSA
jgi:hypothetical protein